MTATANFFVADAAHLPLADKSVDLVFGSPPYCDARSYGIARRPCAEWIEWMLTVTAEAVRVSRGLVIWIVAGVTRDCASPRPGGDALRMVEAWRKVLATGLLASRGYPRERRQARAAKRR